ncbi:MAG: exopolysaccharide biosynthesis protein [Proteobacteria bacterium]|nr:exopolysaccharide biosynthesis protein [Pseudomonadota bacterium]
MLIKTFKKPSRRSSEILLEITQDESLDESLSYQYILQALGERAFGIGILFFSLPSALPLSIVPGFSVIFSVPIAIFALEMVFARKSLWLPKIIAQKTISRAKVSKVILVIVPYLVRLEKLSKPRWAWMTYSAMERINGIVIFCLAILLMLPIPFSNFIFGVLLIIFSLGITEKDGILIFMGHLFFILYVTFVCLFLIRYLHYVI